jgi:hypothetical protein
MRFILLAVVMVLASATPGCADDDDGDIVVVEAIPPGALTVQWTIAGGTDPDACAVYGADTFELVVFDAFGDFVVETNDPCEAFVTTFDIDDGLYDADATLVDRADRAATTTVTLDALDVIGGTELVVDVDFPISSFL